MAKEKVVVTEQKENTVPQQQEVVTPAAPVEQKTEIVAPKTSDSEPKTDKPSESAKVETPKKQKKASKPTKDKPSTPAKDKSEKPAEEKPAESADKPDGKKKATLKVKDKKKDEQRVSFAAEVKRLKAAGLSEEEIKVLLAVKFPIDKKDGKPATAESARDKMFPAEFTVHGVKFTRVELQADKDGDFTDAFCAANDTAAEKENCVIMLGFNWDKELLVPKGKSKKSEYEKAYGVIPPPEFPHGVEMCSVDAVLQNKMHLIVSHSIYTEYPGISDFGIFAKRAKENWFVCNDVPFEVYIGDYSEADESVAGDFINLYPKTSDNK